MAKCARCGAEFPTSYMDTVETCPACGTTYYNDSPELLTNAVPQQQPQTISNKVLQLLADSKNKELILRYLHFSKDEVSADMFPGGIPKLYRENDAYTVILGYDDMRGPQGIYQNLDPDTAAKKLVEAVAYQISHPRDLLYYHPEAAELFSDDRRKQDK